MTNKNKKTGTVRVLVNDLTMITRKAANTFEAK